MLLLLQMLLQVSASLYLELKILHPHSKPTRHKPILLLMVLVLFRLQNQFLEQLHLLRLNQNKVLLKAIP